MLRKVAHATSFQPRAPAAKPSEPGMHPALHLEPPVLTDRPGPAPEQTCCLGSRACRHRSKVFKVTSCTTRCLHYYRIDIPNTTVIPISSRHVHSSSGGISWSPLCEVLSCWKAFLSRFRLFRSTATDPDGQFLLTCCLGSRAESRASLHCYMSVLLPGGNTQQRGKED